MQTGSEYYKKVAIKSEVDTANPHRVVQLLLEGFIAKTDSAIYHIEHNHVKEKCEAITKALDIIIALRNSLDHKQGQAIADELAKIYEFIEIHLVEANMDNSIEKLNQCKKIITEIKSGWEQIPQETIDEFINNKT